MKIDSLSGCDKVPEDWDEAFDADSLMFQAFGSKWGPAGAAAELGWLH